MWIEGYNCGCSSEARYKRDLLGYCAIHGDDRRELHNVRKGADPADIQCPVCGYYCSGKGGVFCIDKPALQKKI